MKNIVVFLVGFMPASFNRVTNACSWHGTEVRVWLLLGFYMVC
jgi:hypothetical protein